MSEPERAPAVWTPEDAANFLRSAIAEAQRPLGEALRRQGMPRWLFLLVLAMLLALAAVGGQWAAERMEELSREARALRTENTELRDRLAKSGAEQAAAEARRERDALREQEMRARIEEAERKVREAETESALARERIAEARSGRNKEVETLIEERAGLRGRETAAAERIARLQQDLAAAQAEAETGRRRLSAAAQALDATEAEREALRRQTSAFRELLSPRGAEAAGGVPAPALSAEKAEPAVVPAATPIPPAPASVPAEP